MTIEASNAPPAFPKKASGRHELLDGNVIAEFHFPARGTLSAGLMEGNAGENADADTTVAPRRPIRHLRGDLLRRDEHEEDG
jgi:hypothetical protein